MIPHGNAPCIEKYLRIAPVQSAAAGFTPKDVFITEGQFIYKYDFSSGTISPVPFAQVGCPFSDHSSLTFDKVGTFGFKMIVACENGPIWTVDGAGNVTFVASTTTLQSTSFTHPEGPAIPPLSFGPLGGQILVGDEDLHQVTAIKNDGTVTYNAFNWAPGFEALPENVNVIPDPACGFGCIPNQPQGSFFQAIEDFGFFLYYGPLDFAGLGGNVIVTNEAEPPATTAGTLLVTFNPVSNAYDTTVFDPTFNFTINEGAQFVECDAVTPTPTPTATSTPTSTPTATFTPTATATATFTPTATATATPTATATATATPTPTPTPTVTPTTCGTAFAIGDLDAVVGNHVTFWSKQWWKDNHLSGGRAPASFKGFVNCTNPNPPACGGTWTSDPGNSGHPPDTIPADITVIVSSSITKSGSTESGDIVKLVTVHVDPCCYGQPVEAPGHEGRGTVTAVICPP